MKIFFCTLLILYSANYLSSQTNTSPDSFNTAPGFLRSNLIQLNWAETELNQISKTISGEIYLRNNATEKKFKKNISNADIIHIATHTIIDDENPIYSKMIFYDDPDTLEDNFLNTYEIYSLETNAQMVVLSACNTGYGKLVNGEGSLSLARGFMYSGIPSVIMSLWQVDDQSTYKIMNTFYQNISKNKRKDEALRQAKLHYIQNSNPLLAGPYYWAGFVPHGNTEPIKSTNNTLLLYAFSIFTFVVLASLYYRKRILFKQKKTN